MRQDERKGAWTLLVAVLVFGAIVWGIGGRQFREDRMKAEENQDIEVNVIKNPADSTANADKGVSKKKKDKNSSKKNKKSTRGSTGKKSSAAISSSRDILSDTIKNSKP